MSLLFTALTASSGSRWGVATLEPPTILSVAGITGSHLPGATLTAVAAVFLGADHETMEWLKNGVAVSNDPTYSDTVDGDSIVLRCTATNEDGDTIADSAEFLVSEVVTYDGNPITYDGTSVTYGDS